MKRYKKWPNKPMVDEQQAEMFIELFDDATDKKAAKCLFVDGLSNEKTAEALNYSTRQIERIRAKLLKIAVIKLLAKLNTV